MCPPPRQLPPHHAYQPLHGTSTAMPRRASQGSPKRPLLKGTTIRSTFSIVKLRIIMGRKRTRQPGLQHQTPACYTRSQVTGHAWGWGLPVLFQETSVSCFPPGAGHRPRLPEVPWASAPENWPSPAPAEGFLSPSAVEQAGGLQCLGPGVSVQQPVILSGSTLSQRIKGT